LQLTLARAVTPRMQKRADALRKMEDMIATQEQGRPIGIAGHLLGSIARAFPVSERAIRLKLRGLGPQGLVEVAEQIELPLRPAHAKATLGKLAQRKSDQ
jgi:hypothetical protein